MSKLIECPSCLGTGEEVFRGKYAKPCRTCTGLGVVTRDKASNFLGEHLYDTLEE